LQFAVKTKAKEKHFGVLIFAFFLCLLYFAFAFPYCLAPSTYHCIYLSTAFIFALVFNVLLQTAHCKLPAVFPFSVWLLTPMNFRLHPSCGYSFRFVFRQNLKSANSLRSNKADL